MRNQIITIVLSVVFSLIFTQGVSSLRLGSNVTSTASSDTLETFRTNVNSSLTSLQSFASSTSLTGIIASSTPFGSVGIEQGTETASFWVGNNGSSTPSFMIKGVNGNGGIGIGSSSPSGTLGLGTTGATTTIYVGNLCLYGTDPSGRKLFVTLSTTLNAAFSTSTTPCI